jgi:hypothetical protein
MRMASRSGAAVPNMSYRRSIGSERAGASAVGRRAPPPRNPDFPLILIRSIRQSAWSLRAAAWLGHPDESLEVSRPAKLWNDTETPEQFGATRWIYRNLANRQFSFSLGDKSPMHSPTMECESTWPISRELGGWHIEEDLAIWQPQPISEFAKAPAEAIRLSKEPGRELRHRRVSSSLPVLSLTNFCPLD